MTCGSPTIDSISYTATAATGTWTWTWTQGSCAGSLTGTYTWDADFTPADANGYGPIKLVSNMSYDQQLEAPSGTTQPQSSWTDPRGWGTWGGLGTWTRTGGPCAGDGTYNINPFGPELWITSPLEKSGAAPPRCEVTLCFNCNSLFDGDNGGSDIYGSPPVPGECGGPTPEDDAPCASNNFTLSTVTVTGGSSSELDFTAVQPIVGSINQTTTYGGGPQSYQATITVKEKDLAAG